MINCTINVVEKFLIAGVIKLALASGGVYKSFFVFLRFDFNDGYQKTVFAVSSTGIIIVGEN